MSSWTDISPPSIWDWLTSNAQYEKPLKGIEPEQITFVRPTTDNGIRITRQGCVTDNLPFNHIGVRTLTLRPNQAVPFHRHNDKRKSKYYNFRGPGTVFVIIQKGSGTYHVHRLSTPGESVLVPAGEWHAVVSYDVPEHRPSAMEILIVYDDPADIEWEPNTNTLLENKHFDTA